MNLDIIDSDEAFAQFLQEQEKSEAESLQNADLELALKLANEEEPDCQIIQDPSSSTGTSSSSSSSNNYYTAPIQDPSSSKGTSSSNYYTSTREQQLNHDLELARELERAERESQKSSLSLVKQLQLKEQQANDDHILAKQLENKVDDSILDEELPNLHQLFLYFNEKYFNNQLNMVEVKWSQRMTLCAGTCAYRPGGHCVVTLSEPLLKFRPKKDYCETLLHEMIHALLFVTSRNTDRDGHGPEFLREAARIGKASGFTITVYHNFHDEVKHYKTHVWKCDGPCKDLPPYYGTCSRSMNRPPQKADTWFDEHQRTCGGTWHKIASPTPKEKPESKKRKKQSNTLDNYFADVDEKMKKLKEF